VQPFKQCGVDFKSNNSGALTSDSGASGSGSDAELVVVYLLTSWCCLVEILLWGWRPYVHLSGFSNLVILSGFIQIFNFGCGWLVWV
jgi:hypothetical protein